MERREAKGRGELGKAGRVITRLTNSHGVVSHNGPDVHLQKLVPLEVHDRVGNAKITKNNNLMSK